MNIQRSADVLLCCGSLGRRAVTRADQPSYKKSAYSCIVDWREEDPGHGSTAWNGRRQAMLVPIRLVCDRMHVAFMRIEYSVETTLL